MTCSLSAQVRRNLPTTIHGLNSLEKQLQCFPHMARHDDRTSGSEKAADQKSRQAAAAALVRREVLLEGAAMAAAIRSKSTALPARLSAESVLPSHTPNSGEKRMSTIT